MDDDGNTKEPDKDTSNPNENNKEEKPEQNKDDNGNKEVNENPGDNTSENETGESGKNPDNNPEENQENTDDEKNDTNENNQIEKPDNDEDEELNDDITEEVEKEDEIENGENNIDSNETPNEEQEDIVIEENVNDVLFVNNNINLKESYSDDTTTLSTLNKNSAVHSIKKVVLNNEIWHNINVIDENGRKTKGWVKESHLQADVPDLNVPNNVTLQHKLITANASSVDWKQNESGFNKEKMFGQDIDQSIWIYNSLVNATDMLNYHFNELREFGIDIDSLLKEKPLILRLLDREELPNVGRYWIYPGVMEIGMKKGDSSVTKQIIVHEFAHHIGYKVIHGGDASTPGNYDEFGNFKDLSIIASGTDRDQWKNNNQEKFAEAYSELFLGDGYSNRSATGNFDSKELKDEFFNWVKAKINNESYEFKDLKQSNLENKTMKKQKLSEKNPDPENIPNEIKKSDSNKKDIENEELEETEQEKEIEGNGNTTREEDKLESSEENGKRTATKKEEIIKDKDIENKELTNDAITNNEDKVESEPTEPDTEKDDFTLEQNNDSNDLVLDLSSGEKIIIIDNLDLYDNINEDKSKIDYLKIGEEVEVVKTKKINNTNWININYTNFDNEEINGWFTF